MSSKTKFLIYCIEIYKHAEKLTGKQVSELFDRYNLFDYITECYEILHIHGNKYVIEDINEYIESQEKYSVNG